jgi:uncharacterized protein with HEPN domain
MKGSRDSRDFLNDILTAIVDIQSFVDDLSYEEFASDKKTLYAVVRSIEVIGEAVKNLPEQLKVQYPQVPWRRMTGMRDKLVHGYFGIDFKTLYKAAVEDIPPLKPLIEKIMGEQERLN